MEIDMNEIQKYVAKNVQVILDESSRDTISRSYNIRKRRSQRKSRLLI